MRQPSTAQYSKANNINAQSSSQAIRSYSLRHPLLFNFGLCLFSACLLILSFPKTDIWFFAWVGLVPFMFAIDGKRPWISFLFGYFLGVLFFAGTLYWFVYVTTLGASLLVLYLSVYFALFALGYSVFSRENILVKLIVLPSLWVALEFVRGHLLTGFGWVSLGHSQYKILPIIQIVDVTGMFGVSFLVVMVNIIAKEWLDTRIKNTSGSSQKIFGSLIIVLCLIVFVLGYGAYRLAKEIKSSAGVKVAVVQANTPQELKWKKEAWPSIMTTYLELTGEVAKKKPDLIIWPETAFPGFIWEAPQLFLDLRSFVARMETPLLLGVVTQSNEAYYNSALLIDREGEVVEQYDKLHLVPFGEYVPLRNFFPILSDIVPIGDFNAGNELTLFPLFLKNDVRGQSVGNFSVLICFEDTVPEISRDFVNAGTNLLVNITNDAWFHDTQAPFMHMQDSIFRAVENRKYLIRAANTGVSCFIDPYGKIIGGIQDGKKKRTYTAGYAVETIGLNLEKTFYTKYGDVFTYLCFGGILWGIVGRIRSRFFLKRGR